MLTEKEKELVISLQSDDMRQVYHDIMTGTPPADSKLHYDEKLLAYRKIAEAQVAAMPKGHIIELPT